MSNVALSYFIGVLMFCVVLWHQHNRWSRGYRCMLCGTKRPDKHDEECPWKR